MFQLSVNKLYAVGKLIFLALKILAMADLPRFSRGWESRKKS